MILPDRQPFEYWVDALVVACVLLIGTATGNAIVMMVMSAVCFLALVLVRMRGTRQKSAVEIHRPSPLHIMIAISLAVGVAIATVWAIMR